jgi:hypothetical protein
MRRAAWWKCDETRDPGTNRTGLGCVGNGGIFCNSDELCVCVCVLLLLRQAASEREREKRGSSCNCKRRLVGDLPTNAAEAINILWTSKVCSHRVVVC